MIKLYNSDLHVKGEAPRLQIENNTIEVGLRPLSGHFDQLSLERWAHNLPTWLLRKSQLAGAMVRPPVR